MFSMFSGSLPLELARQFFDQAMSALVDDVKKLAQPEPTASVHAKNCSAHGLVGSARGVVLHC